LRVGQTLNKLPIESIINVIEAPQIEAQYPLQSIVQGYIISSEELYASRLRTNPHPYGELENPHHPQA